jgi:tripartite-type tricarboxylate transporter receptor subunit TctC
MLKRALIATLLTLPLAVSGTAAVAAYPEKPIKLVLPYRAGGGTDGLARTIQAAVEKHGLMSQPLVVVNVTGAGGAIGAREVKDAKPDGYTFLQMHNEMFALATTGRLGFDPREAYEPVAQTTQSCLYLAVPGDSPFQRFEDLVAYAKANPGKLKLADIIGGISHFPAVMMMDKLGIKFGVVHTGGTSKRFASLKGGHTQMAFMSPGWIKRGGDDLRGLLWLGAERMPGVDMPTAKEKGLDVTACLNRRFWAPAGTPREAIDYFAGVLEKAMQTPELIEYHKKRFGTIRVRTGDELSRDIDEEMARFEAFAPVVKASMQK